MNSAMVIEPFDPNLTVWDRWVDRLRHLFRALQVDEDRQVLVFMAIIGQEGCETLVDRVYPSNPTSFSFEQLVSVLDEVYSSNTTEIKHINSFMLRKQHPFETASHFLESLIKLAKFCNFGRFKERAIRDQFVYGLQDERVKSKLLEQTYLTLAGAKVLACAASRQIAAQQLIAPKSTTSSTEKQQDKLKKAPRKEPDNYATLPPNTNPPEIPEDPEDALEYPKDTPEDPEGAPEDPEGAPEYPKDTPEDPEGAPEDPEGAPEDPEGAPEDPEDVPKDPEGVRGGPVQKQLPKPVRGYAWRYTNIHKVHRFPMWGSIGPNKIIETFATHAPLELTQKMNEAVVHMKTHKEVAAIVTEHILKDFEFLLSPSSLISIGRALVDAYPRLRDPDLRRTPEYIYIHHRTGGLRGNGGLLMAKYDVAEVTETEAEEMASGMKESSDNFVDILRFVTKTFHLRRAMLVSLCPPSEILAKYPMLLWYNGSVLQHEFNMNFADREKRHSLSSIHEALERLPSGSNTCSVEESQSHPSIKCIGMVADWMKLKSLLKKCIIRCSSDGELDVWQSKSTTTHPFVACHGQYSAVIEGTVIRCGEDFDLAFELVLKAYALFVYKQNELFDFFLYGFYKPAVITSKKVRKLYKQLFSD